MNKVYDCAIVGAGPSGGSAAYHLAKNGHDVLVIEKETLPRYKPCGGGISPEVQSWFDFDFSPAISTKTNRFQYTWQMQDPIYVELERPIWMVRRDTFDHFLIRKSVDQGAELMENTKVKGIIFKNNHWQIDTSQGIFEANYLIAADGAKGQTAKMIGMKERKRLIGGAIEVEAPCERNDDNTAYFEFGMVKHGYLWNFPKSDGHSIGIGIFRGTDHEDLKEIAAKYARGFNIDFNNAEHFGHPLYIWDGNQPLHSNNKRAVLVGEAACLVDPLTAEGIRPSILSGIKASEAVHKALSRDEKAIERYTEVIREEIGKDMKWAELLAKVLYNFPGLCYRHLLKRPSASRAMGRIFCGEMSYRELPGNILFNIHNLFT